jgi:uncharacterized protein with GYD domain
MQMAPYLISVLEETVTTGKYDKVNRCEAVRPIRDGVCEDQDL